MATPPSSRAPSRCQTLRERVGANFGRFEPEAIQTPPTGETAVLSAQGVGLPAGFAREVAALSFNRSARHGPR
jgi:hypothetical protein